MGKWPFLSLGFLFFYLLYLSIYLSLSLSVFLFSFFHQLLPAIIYHFHLSMVDKLFVNIYFFFTSMHLGRSHTHTHTQLHMTCSGQWKMRRGDDLCPFQQKYWRAGASVPSFLLPGAVIDSVDGDASADQSPWMKTWWSPATVDSCCCVRPVRFGECLLLNLT